MAKRKIRKCPCGNEVPVGRNTSKFCSEACYDKYGGRRGGSRDMSPESKINNAEKLGLKWVEGQKKEDLVHWYTSNRRFSKSCNNLCRNKFFDDFDKEFGLMYAEIVGLMYRIQRYGKEEGTPKTRPAEKA